MDMKGQGFLAASICLNLSKPFVTNTSQLPGSPKCPSLHGTYFSASYELSEILPKARKSVFVKISMH